MLALLVALAAFIVSAVLAFVLPFILAAIRPLVRTSIVAALPLRARLRRRTFSRGRSFLPRTLLAWLRFARRCLPFARYIALHLGPRWLSCRRRRSFA